ncbi:hypothetical protein [Luteococcus sp.]|uniref:hypothetical protein n=1 Tax=Luteococcus sp. TaxID=1969402 RepID=UPI00373634A8
MTTYPETYVLPDATQDHDHAGALVAPLTSTGHHFTYALRHDSRQVTIYATNAHAILATLIDHYDPRDLDATDPTNDRQLELTRIDQRSRHAYHATINHAAQAILRGAPDDVVAVLQRSTDYTRPLTHTELAEWTHEIPLVLIGSFYGPGQAQPPTGNVVMLRTDDADDYLHDLAQIGAIHLIEHCSAITPPVRVMVDIDPSPTTTLQPRLDALDQATRALKATPNDTNTTIVRERAAALVAVLQNYPIEGIDLASVQQSLDQIEEPTVLARTINRDLVQPLRAEIAAGEGQEDS